ncbi:hypothetical protein BDV33DRAFT_185960, partial [Aspergillus novoparasiticus]
PIILRSRTPSVLIQLHNKIYGILYGVRLNQANVTLSLLLLHRLRRYISLIHAHWYFEEALFVALALAHKVSQDCTLRNSDWAFLAGIETRVFNALELKFLYHVQWNMLVSPKEWCLWVPIQAKIQRSLQMLDRGVAPICSRL